MKSNQVDPQQKITVFIPIKIGSDLEDVTHAGNQLADYELVPLVKKNQPSNFSIYALFDLIGKRLTDSNNIKPLEVALTPGKAAEIITRDPNWPRSWESDKGFKILELEIKASDLFKKGEKYLLQRPLEIKASSMSKLVNGENYIHKDKRNYSSTLEYTAFNPFRDNRVDRTITEIELIRPTLTEEEIARGNAILYEKIQQHNDEILTLIRRVCGEIKKSDLSNLDFNLLISEINNSTIKPKYTSEDRLLVIHAILAKAEELSKKNPNIPLKIDKITDEVVKALNKKGAYYFNANLSTYSSGIFFSKKTNPFKKIAEMANRIHNQYNVQSDSIPVLQKQSTFYKKHRT